jgi:uncharacterized membrane protein YkgB
VEASAEFMKLHTTVVNNPEMKMVVVLKTAGRVVVKDITLGGSCVVCETN